jgi:hypothetical protein
MSFLKRTEDGKIFPWAIIPFFAHLEGVWRKRGRHRTSLRILPGCSSGVLGLEIQQLVTPQNGGPSSYLLFCGDAHGRGTSSIRVIFQSVICVIIPLSTHASNQE